MPLLLVEVRSDHDPPFFLRRVLPTCGSTGVVGLAACRALALEGQHVILLEAEKAVGTHTSSRNSEVIHSGAHKD